MREKNYYRILLGEGNRHVERCRTEGFIGLDYGVGFNLDALPDDRQGFNREFKSRYLEKNPDRKKSVAAYCGYCYKLAKTMRPGDVVLCREKDQNYSLGEVAGDYFYLPDEKILPHRRKLKGLDKRIGLEAMSGDLKASVKSQSTAIRISKHADEIERLLAGDTQKKADASSSLFAMENHLEDFLVQNWEKTPLGKDYDIFEVDGELIGKQYPTDSGRIDILAVSKDEKEFLVLELKRNKSTDKALGQVQRYMGEVMTELAIEGQSVKGLIIAHRPDERLKNALKVAPNVAFCRYELSFNLLQEA